MVIELDFASDTPIYVQLRNQIVKGFSKGELKAGEKLPTVRQLASDAGVNTMTVNKTYQIAICFLNFVNIIIFVSVYTIWIFVFVFGIIHLHQQRILRNLLSLVTVSDFLFIQTQDRVEIRTKTHSRAADFHYKNHHCFISGFYIVYPSKMQCCHSKRS